jgi:multisubunit Na+/H+ antiporter MnhF subunit
MDFHVNCVYFPIYIRIVNYADINVHTSSVGSSLSFTFYLVIRRTSISNEITVFNTCNVHVCTCNACVQCALMWLAGLGLIDSHNVLGKRAGHASEWVETRA